MISFDCPHCTKKLQVKDEFAGQQGKCPSCGSTMSIPRSSQEAPAVARPVAQAVDTAPDKFETAEPYAEQRDREEPREAPRPKKKAKSSRQTGYDEDAFEPPQNMTNHGGGDINAKDEFFASPPPEIGEVVSCHTTLRKNVEPISPGARLTGAVVAGAAGLALGIVIGVATKSGWGMVFLGMILAGIGMAIVLLCTGFKHTCTYVGREGVARFTCKGSRDRITGKVFCFKDAAELRTQQTRHYTNGVYQGTNYAFTWSDVAGREVFKISGTHKSEQGNPPAKDPFQFAGASELAWTNYLLGQVQAQLQMQGNIFFGLGGKNWVKLAEAFISVHMNGVTTECHAEDIAEVRIEQGMVEVRRKDAKKGWFSSQGIFRFPYGSLANAQLFLFLMDKLVGVRIN